MPLGCEREGTPFLVCGKDQGRELQRKQKGKKEIFETRISLSLQIAFQKSLEQDQGRESQPRQFLP